MSTIQDDKKVLEEKNKPALPDEAVADLYDQIPANLATTLNEMNVGQKIAEIWHKGNAEKSEWMERQEMYLDDWDEFLDNDFDGPFDGSSQLHLPETFTRAKAMHARLMQAMFGVEPSFNVKPQEEVDLQRIPMIEGIMNYTLTDYANNNEGVSGECSDWVWNGVTTGTGLMKARWDKKFIRFSDIFDREIPRPSAIPGQPADIEIVQEERMVTEKVFDGPMLDVIFPEDLLAVGGKGDIETAEVVIHRSFFTGSDMTALAAQKVFLKKEVEEIIESGNDREEGAIATSLKQKRSSKAGMSSVDSEAELDKYEILEAYLKMDVNKDGLNEDVIIWVHPRSRRVLRATYLHRVSKYGKKPFFKFDYFRRPGEFYGIGLPEMMHSLSIEMDALHNQAVDAGTIANMPFGFYRATSNIEPEIINLAPGDLIPLDDPLRDINFPNIPSKQGFFTQAESSVRDQADRVTAISPLSLGMLNQQGATRTATGTSAIQGESNINLDTHVRNLARAWRSCLKYMFGLLQQRIPRGLSFRVTGMHGSDYFGQINDREEIKGKFDFIISENSANSNQGIQQNMAMQVMQQTLDPVAIQMGIVTGAEIFEAKKNFYQQQGVKDWSRFVRQPNVAPRITAENEANSVLQGIPVPVQPDMDHEGFIKYVEYIMSKDELLGQYRPEQVQQLVAQQRQHQEMMKALEQMRNQQANQNQIAINAASGQGQQPPQPSQQTGEGGSEG
ncbi:MAG: portal protein [Candidatus Baldrarchaeia archaeon]